jgi:predicted nucleotidyltransferase
MSVISYLDGRASNAILSALEELSVTTSVNTISARLTSHFGTNIKEKFKFGSYTRGTILPRSMDEQSDIDYMVVFTDRGYTPQTYLDRLKKFAEKYYYSSDIKQSSPSVVLELSHIKFDLVPAVKEIYSDYEIPNGPNAWQTTNPNDFNATLTAKNNAEMHKIKPMIRLLKYWNAINGYVFDSYSLEKYVVGLDYTFAYNIRDYLYVPFNNLSLSYRDAQWRRDKLQRAKDIIAQVRAYEAAEMPATAEAEIKRLIPAAV